MSYQRDELQQVEPDRLAVGQGSRANPYVFLVGTPRSGTTMLKRMINAHPLIAITRETHWIPDHFEKQNGVDAQGRITAGIVDALYGYHRFEQLKLDRERLEEMIAHKPHMTYAALVTLIFDLYGLRKHKPLVGDKTPCYVSKLPLLHALWPQAKFIHLIRDGRDVCLSMLNWRMAHKDVGRFSTWERDPIVTTALWWKALVGIGRQQGLALGSNQYLEVTYDSLVEKSEAECRRFAQFLNVDYHDSMHNYYLGRTQSAENMSANAAWLPPTPGMRNWRTEMFPEDVAKFEAAAGNLLEDLGFDLSPQGITAEIKENVAGIRAQFRIEALARKWRLPEIW